MKYLKKFEYDNELSNIKRYIVFKFPSNLIVLEVFEITTNYITCTRLYRMSIGSSKILNSDKSDFEFDINSIKKRVIFQSDSLKEVLDILPELSEIDNNINKYNL